MRIGFIGDIVGRPGRKIIKENLTKIKKEFEIDFVIGNGENASHGFGLTIDGAKELLRTGEDVYKELNLNQIDDEETLIDFMVKNPILIERPIIIKGDKAVIARPIENLSELIK